jgi:hypothetical protein
MAALGIAIAFYYGINGLIASFDQLYYPANSASGTSWLGVAALLHRRGLGTRLRSCISW